MKGKGRREVRRGEETYQSPCFQHSPSFSICLSLRSVSTDVAFRNAEMSSCNFSSGEMHSCKQEMSYTTEPNVLMNRDSGGGAMTSLNRTHCCRLKLACISMATEKSRLWKRLIQGSGLVERPSSTGSRRDTFKLVSLSFLHISDC